MKLAFWILLSFSAGAVGSFFRPGAWYESLAKPAWNPPNWIFPPVWSALYLMMGVAAWLVWREGSDRRAVPIALFLIQLLFNALWSWIFFGLHRIGWGMADIVLLWIFLLAATVRFFAVSRLAGSLMIPYLLWVSFAAALNAALCRLNSTLP